LSEHHLDSIIHQRNGEISEGISSILKESSSIIFGVKRMELVQEIISRLDSNLMIHEDVVKEIEEFVTLRSNNPEEQYFVKVRSLITFCTIPKYQNISQALFDTFHSIAQDNPSFRDSVTRLSTVIENDHNLIGFDVKEIASTLPAILARSISASVYAQLNNQWFRFIGGEIDTTRPFCQHREGEVFHRKEIEAWGRGDNSGGIHDIINGDWEGRIESTDEESIFYYLGGWGCRHSLVPVPQRRVPEDIIMRVKSEGYEV
jgi:hypothetical protein